VEQRNLFTYEGTLHDGKLQRRGTGSTSEKNNMEATKEQQDREILIRIVKPFFLSTPQEVNEAMFS